MVLLLRGPKTVGELRGRTERAYKFEDLAEAEATLDELEESGYVTKLPRMAGRKESRYAHLLAGEVQVEEAAPRLEPAAIVVRAENERITALEEEVQRLRQEFDKFKREFE